ncbi:peptidase C39 [Helicobacter didelphidarum]|uniref:Peptidase C39 n=1 Tax=Helicobacter didelphidarum TaxID=2040648 RepID=A0A3D8ICI3_9HELI|nr:C39 family peptidase [Helicobacter didelphidarum]RDU62474.1 peptidase C39 [Helicobacter didelphidarum]
MKKFILFIAFCMLCFGRVHIHNDSVMIDKSVTSWSEIRNRNLTRQQFDYSCGSASLSTILTYYYGVNVSEKEILESVLLSKGIDVNKREELEKDERLKKTLDLSFLDLSHYAESKGFKAVGLALDLETLKKLKAPVIVYVNVRDIEHFSVYKGMSKDFIYLADPSFGNIKIRMDKFQEMFYRRSNTSHPGKILAILPNDKNIQINPEFMSRKEHVEFMYEVIENKIQ